MSGRVGNGRIGGEIRSAGKAGGGREMKGGDKGEINKSQGSPVRVAHIAGRSFTFAKYYIFP